MNLSTIMKFNNNYENYFYFLAWSCAIFYSVYEFYLSNKCKAIENQEVKCYNTDAFTLSYVIYTFRF